MREIKFRAWDKEGKRMIVHEQEFIPLKVTSIGVFKLDPCIKENRWELIEGNRFELMQHTGLKDKNGTEIYEGDILLYSHKAVGKLKRAVVYKYGAFGIEGRVKGTHIMFGNILESEREVIGNIYENKDLLE